MNQNVKKYGLIAVIVAAVAIAAFSAKGMFTGDQIQVEKTVKVPEGMKSEKQQFLEEQAARQSGQAAPSGKDDAGARDLGGDLGGGG